jgi:hypothetical protein
MKTLADLARFKGTVADDLKVFPYDHSTQRRLEDPEKSGMKYSCKSSTAFDGERDTGGDDA